jgi:Amt family ammonium transporter
MRARGRLWRRLLALAIASFILAMYGLSIYGQDATPEATPEAETVAEETAAETDVATEESVVLSTEDRVAAVESAVGGLTISVDTSWVLLTGFLVFFMQTGFALLEAGLVRQTGVVNALLENFIDAGLTALIFWAVGFGIAFGSDAGGIIGTDNFFLSKAIIIQEGTILYPSIMDANPDLLYPNLTVLTFFFFQFAFAATASTITTGAMAERTDFIGDLIYTGLMAAFTYPIIVHWVWGGGWLGDNSFHDFAGSTVVHTVGGITSIVGAWMLGARPRREFGKFPPAHNLSLATLGTMILWFGWYGFNPGSTLGIGNTGLVGLVILNTTLGAGAGAVTTMLLLYFRTGKWDLVFTLNGSLAGLVAVTAGCAFFLPQWAIVVGAVAGVLVYYSVEFIEGLKIDDPVGAFSVHGACGIWGTIAIGLFAQPELAFGYFAGKGGLFAGGGFEMLITQVIGSLSVVAATAVMAYIMFALIRSLKLLRVHPAGDKLGIDAFEHGVSAYPDTMPMPNMVITPRSSGSGD